MEYTHDFFGYEINLLSLQAIAKPRFVNGKVYNSQVVIPLLFHDISELSDFVIVDLKDDEKFSTGNAINKVNYSHPNRLQDYNVYDRIIKGIEELKQHWQQALTQSINKQVNG